MGMAETASYGIPEGLVDFTVLDRWMDARGLPPGEITAVSSIPGGTQNVLIRFTRGPREYVLRRPPRHLRRASNEVLRREARVLAALAGSDVPHPGLVAAEPDPDARTAEPTLAAELNAVSGQAQKIFLFDDDFLVDELIDDHLRAG
mgnify:CR=1 FL=1